MIQKLAEDQRKAGGEPERLQKLEWFRTFTFDPLKRVSIEDWRRPADQMRGSSGEGRWKGATGIDIIRRGFEKMP